MLENLKVSAAIVLPFFVYLLIGMMLKKIDVLDDDLAGRVNNLLFKVFMPVNIFNSIYKTELGELFSTPAVPYAICGVLLSMLLLTKVSKKLSDDPGQQAAIVHAGFRGNVMLFALPIAQGIYGEEVAEVLIILTAFMLTANFTAVPLMESYRNKVRIYRGEDVSGEKTGFVHLLGSLFKTPILDAVVIGFLWALFKIPLPDVGVTVVKGLSGCVIPLAFICMGARLDIGHLKRNSNKVLIVSFFKLIIAPAVFCIVPIAAGWSEKYLVGMIAAFGSPSAIVSYTMCENYECDGDLAGEIVTFSSMFSLFTLFLWIFCFKQAGLIS